MSSNDEIDGDSILSYNSLGRGDAKKLEKFSPEGLASWQAGWKPTAAKWLLAEKEWERRARRPICLLRFFINELGPSDPSSERPRPRGSGVAEKSSACSYPSNAQPLLTRLCLLYQPKFPNAPVDF